MAAHNEIGTWGEDWVARQLGAFGPVQHGGRADLRVGALEVEVKTAQLSDYDGKGTPGYQFCLHRAGRDGIEAAVVVCICLTPHWQAVAFVLPAAVLGTRRKMCIPADFAGKWQPYREGWALIPRLQEVQNVEC